MEALLERCHRALARTRGVVMSLASLSAREPTMTWLGVGNVEGVVARSNGAAMPAQPVLLLRAGVVGQQLPALQPETLPIRPMLQPPGGTIDRKPSKVHLFVPRHF